MVILIDMNSSLKGTNKIHDPKMGMNRFLIIFRIWENGIQTCR